jgi:hypothetical protein
VLARDEAVRHFVKAEVTTQLFKALCERHYVLSDPACIGALRDLLELQKTILNCLGQEYLAYLHTDCWQGMLGFAPEVGQAYCQTLQQYQSHNNQAGDQWKAFGTFFMELRKKANCNPL